MKNVICRHVVPNILALGLCAGSAMAFDLGGMLSQVQQAAQKQVTQAQRQQVSATQEATAGKTGNAPVGASEPSQHNGTMKLIEQIVSMVAISSSASYTANGWEMLAKTFPKAKWKDGDNKTYPMSRTTTMTMKNPEGVLTISALGNRSMLVNVDASFDSPEGAPLFRDLRDSRPFIRKICAIDESESSAEIYYQVNLAGFKPVTVMYEYSAGSGGGGDSITAGEMELPASCGKKVAGTSKPSTQTVTVASTLSAIPKAYQGWWAENCKVALKAAKHEELIGYEIKADGIHQMELHCSVTQVTQVPSAAGSKQLLVNTSCDSPDGDSEWKIALELNQSGKLIISDPADKSIKGEVLSRCGK